MNSFVSLLLFSAHVPAGILIDWLQLTPQSTESLCRIAVAVHRAHYIGTSLMNCNMDGEAGWIHCVHVARLDHDAFLVYETQIFRLHVRKGAGKRIDPEMIG